MARIRSGARSAPRHTGREFGTGHQRKYIDDEVIVLGPWERINPRFQGMQSKSDLHCCENMHIVDGALQTLAYETSTVLLNRRVLGSSEVNFLTLGPQHIAFLANTATNVLEIRKIDVTGIPSTHVSAIVTPSSDTVSMVPWSDYLYFGNPDMASIYKFNASTGVYAAVPSTPANPKWLFVLEGNLVVIHTIGGVDWISWSVDSLPENFINAGSGSVLVPGHLGKVMGVALVGSHAVILCEFGALRLIPTGSLPAFRTDNIAMPGCSQQDMVTTDGQLVFYRGYDDSLHVFNGANVQRLRSLGQLTRQWRFLTYSRRMHRVIVNGFIYDPQTLECVGEVSDMVSSSVVRMYPADCPSSVENAIGNWMTYEYDVDNDQTTVRTFALDRDVGTIFRTPTIEQFVESNSEIWLKEVEFVFGRILFDLPPTPFCEVTIYNEGGSTSVVTNEDSIRDGEKLRYKFNLNGHKFKVKFYHPNNAIDFWVRAHESVKNILVKVQPTGFSGID